MNESKCLEYYLDAKNNGREEIEKIIEKTKKEFDTKEVKVNIVLNQFGVYVLTFRFEEKRFQKIKKAIEDRKEKATVRARLAKYYGDYKYGQYKSTGTYKPY